MRKRRVAGIVLLVVSVILFWVANEGFEKSAENRAKAEQLRKGGGHHSDYDTARTMQSFHRTDAFLWLGAGVVTVAVGVWLLKPKRR